MIFLDDNIPIHSYLKLGGMGVITKTMTLDNLSVPYS